MNVQRKKLLMYGLLITAAGVLFRLFRLDAALEYDEIWTLEHYASGSLKTIFTTLSLPNNHPLNSLAVKLTAFSGAAPQWIRLVPFLAGVLAIPLAGIVAFGLWRRRGAALWSMFFTAMLPLAVFYSQLARGYSLQLFFLLLFAAGLYAAKRFPAPGCAGIVLGAAGAMLTLPTSAVYLGAAGTAAAFRCRKSWRKHLPAAISLAAAGAFALAWVLVNFKSLQANRGWGIPIDSFAAFGAFLSNTVNETLPAIVLLAAVPALLFRFRRSLPVLWIWLWVMAAAVVFNAGPPRTGLPLAAATVLLSGAGVALLRRRFPVYGKIILLFFTVLTLAALVSAYRQPHPDWYAIHRTMRQLPPEVLVLFPANDSNPLAWNNAPEAYREQLRRIAPLPPGHPKRSLLVVSRDGALTGCAPNGAERPVPVAAEGVAVEFDAMRGMLYGLEELDGPPEPGDTVVGFIRPLPEAEAKKLLHELTAALRNDFFSFNVWLCTSVTEGGTTYRYYLAGGRADRSDSRDHWERFLREKPGATALYRIVAPGKNR